ncbi:MAG: flavodoxin domain-containing protein [Terrimicrobiaceae bacterium]
MMNRDIAILYATMTGNARECAERTAASLGKAGLPARLHDLAHYDPRGLLEETTVLLPISTWGEGEPPDDGVHFVDYVKSLEPASLCKLRFAVFALGDTSYDNFCQCGRDLDRMFEERGATRLLDRVDNDIDFEGALVKWHEALVALLPDTVAA